MTSPTLLKFEKPRDHERIILENYDWLLGWARQLTQGTSEEAEDLVQDLYVRFVQSQSGQEFRDQDQIRAYLYKSLKNLFISRRLRHGQDAVSGLLVVDFDSLEFAMSAIDRSRLLYVRSDLASICEYACIRRKSSKAAAALILRFFVGYLTTEVMALLRSKRAGVDALIQAARLEAKAYLERPGVLRFLDRSDKRSQTFPKYLPEDSDALFAELQHRIFSQPEGKCMSAEELANRYRQPSSPPFSTEEIAHLVSCRSCLQHATRVLALPDLTLQFVSDPSGPGDATPPAPGSESSDLKKLRRKLREIYEHRPRKLQIAVDGEIRGVQTVSGVSSIFQIKLKPLSKPDFLEVLSEQGFGLLYLDLHQGDIEQPLPQQATVNLSDGRYLSVSLTLTDGAPVIDISYFDPLFESGAEGQPQTVVMPERTPQSTTVGNRAPQKKIALRLIRLLAALKEGFQCFRLLGLVMALGVCLVSTLMLGRRSPRPENENLPNAAEILTRSAAKSKAELPPHGGYHARYSLEEHSEHTAQVRYAQLDSLRSADTLRSALKLRTQRGELVAGRWIDENGKATDYSRMRSRDKEASETNEFDGMWRHAPSAADFDALANGSAGLSVSQTGSGYEVAFTREAISTQPTIVRGELQIARDSMRPIAETLRLQDGQETHEYRFREVSYEILRPEQIEASDFTPGAFAYNLNPRPPLDRNSQLTLRALQILAAQDSDVQAAVDLERTTRGGVTVGGVLPSRVQAQSLTESLRELQGGTSLRLTLHSADEARAVRDISTLEPDPAISTATDTVPLDSVLRESLITHQRLSGRQLDEGVQNEAQRIVTDSARARRAAWDVSQIAARDFRPSELSAMSTEDRQLWLTLLASPLALCDAELTAIAAMVTDESTPLRSQQDEAPIGTVRDLAIAADVFRQDADRLDRLLVAGFAISPDTQSTPINPTELRHQLAEVRREQRELDLTIQRLRQRR